MRDFHQYVQSKNEGFFSDFFKKKWQPPEPIDSRFQLYWSQLVKKYGSEEAAWPEYEQLKSTPAGQFQMMRMTSKIDPRANANVNNGHSVAMTHPFTKTTHDDNLANHEKARRLLQKPDGSI